MRGEEGGGGVRGEEGGGGGAEKGEGGVVQGCCAPRLKVGMYTSMTATTTSALSLHWHLNTSNPHEIDQLEFMLSVLTDSLHKLSRKRQAVLPNIIQDSSSA